MNNDWLKREIPLLFTCKASEYLIIKISAEVKIPAVWKRSWLYFLIF
jgi:hypothetical protein